jgi:hypothetical protein
VPPSAGWKRTTLGPPGTVPSDAIVWEALASGEFTLESLAPSEFVGDAIATAVASLAPDVDASRAA